MRLILRYYTGIFPVGNTKATNGLNQDGRSPGTNVKSGTPKY
jgi:hypothetical protein